MNELELRELLATYGKKLVEVGLVQGTWGNLSIRISDEYMLVTPSGLDYNRLTAEDMVKVNIKTLEYEGNLKPTSEKGLHAGIYAMRPEIGSVIHTHSKYASVFAAARCDVVVRGEASKVFGNRVKLAGYGLPGTKTLKRNTVKAFGDNYGCIMANHGMVCGGESIEAAFDNCMILENYCKSYLDGEA